MKDVHLIETQYVFMPGRPPNLTFPSGGRKRAITILPTELVVSVMPWGEVNARIDGHIVIPCGHVSALRKSATFGGGIGQPMDDLPEWAADAVAHVARGAS
jgi:hypothetical protein